MEGKSRLRTGSKGKRVRRIENGRARERVREAKGE
jgi:hypothetical protein